jgi:hypothetical protein
MARFVQISDDDVERFNEEHENENTRKKVLRHKRLVFLDFLVAEGERRKIEEIPPNELKNLAKRFVLSVRKKNGEVF